MVNMFTLALGCTPREFLNVLVALSDSCYRLVYLWFLPAAFGLGSLPFPNHPGSPGFLIAALPVAMTSAFWTDLAKGNLPLTCRLLP